MAVAASGVTITASGMAVVAKDVAVVAKDVAVMAKDVAITAKRVVLIAKCVAVASTCGALVAKGSPSLAKGIAPSASYTAVTPAGLPRGASHIAFMAEDMACAASGPAVDTTRVTIGSTPTDAVALRAASSAFSTRS